MKPNFALNITETHIALLHRTSRGWMPVGEVAFDDPDLEEAIGYLRASALGLSPQGMTTKLVLPRSQVLYLTVEAPGPDKAARRTQILEALEGRTPYAPDELVFDWWGKGPEVRVAVVARETLEEAEGFAETHRLNPVSFVTIPDGPEFAGEPWFGTSKLSAKLLPEGEKVTRDQDPVAILSRDRSDAKSEGDADAKDQDRKADSKGAADAKSADQKAEDEADAKAAAAIAEAEAAAKAEAEAEERAAAEAARVAAERAEADRMRAEAAAREAEAERALAERREAEKAARRAEEEAARAAARDPADKATETTAPETPLPTFASRRREERQVPPPLTAPAGAAPAGAGPALTGGTSGPGFSAAPRPGLTPPVAPPVPPRPLGAAPATATAPAGPSLTPPPAKEGAAPAPVVNGKAAETGATEGKPPAAQSAPPSAGSAGIAPATAAPAVAGEGTGALPQGPAPKDAPAADKAAEGTKPAGDAGSDVAMPVEAGKGPTVRIVPQGDVPPSQTGKTLLPRAAATATPARPVSGEGLSPAKRLAAMVTAARIPGRSSAATPRKPVMPATTSANPATTDAAPGGFADTALPKRRKTPPQRPGAAASGATPTGMGAFGDRMQRQRGKPRFLGLALTGVLLVVLALIAAWSSVYLSRDDSAPETRSVAGAGMVEPDRETAAAAAPTEPVTDSAAAQDDATPEPPAQQDIAAAPSAESEADLPAAQPEFRPEIAGNAEAAAPGPAGSASEAGQQDEIMLAAMDGPPPAFDAIPLPRPADGPDAAPEAAAPPPPAGTRYEFEADGTIRAGSTGVVTPDGFWLIAARPPILPPERPASAEPETQPGLEAEEADDTAAAATSADDAQPQDEASQSTTATEPQTDAAAETAETTAGEPETEGTDLVFAPSSEVTQRRPESRPASAETPEPQDGTTPPAAQAEDDAALSTAADNQLAGARPRLRPEELAEAASLAAAAAAAEAEAEAARLAALPVPISLRPAGRPADFSRAVAAAVASATQASTAAAAAAPAQRRAAPADVEEEDEPEVVASAAPRIPTRASVAQQATFSNAINLSRINLIGVYGTANNRYALVRSGNGRYTKVKVGDRVDGGVVAAITSNELRYQKGGRMLSLAMPRG